MSKYTEKLKDPRWQKKRLEIFERDGWRCRICANEDETLHVHHLVYRKDCDPWEIHNGLLLTLCSECHKRTKEDDEDMTVTESFMGDVGTLLDTFWKSGFDAHDLLSLAEAIFDCKKPQGSFLGSFKVEYIPFVPKRR